MSSLASLPDVVADGGTQGGVHAREIEDVSTSKAFDICDALGTCTPHDRVSVRHHAATTIDTIRNRV